MFIEVHLDDFHGTGPRLALDLGQANFPQQIRSKIWTVNEVGMRYEHVKRRHVLHNDSTETVPNATLLRVVLHSMELTSCKPAPTPSVAGSVEQKIDGDAHLDMQRVQTLPWNCREPAVRGQLIAVTCYSRRLLAQRR